MKILLIKQLFNPEPTAKSLDFALELKKRGHEVQVLTGFPSYPKGRIYDGYKQRLWEKEKMNGIEVIRVPIYPDQSDSGLKRALHYISYGISASAIGLFLINKPDVAFVYQGAIPVGIPAIILKKLRGVPFLYDISDVWPETIKTSGMLTNSFLLNIIGIWCKINYGYADYITVCAPGFKDNLIKKGVPKDKIEFVSNWSRDEISEKKLNHKRKAEFFPSDKFNILYAGNHGIVQSLDTVLITAEQLQKSNTDKASNIQFVFLGDGADKERLQNIAEEKELNNVKFLPRVESSEVDKYLNTADALLVHLKNTPLFEITIPSKTLAYLKTGKPILMGLKGDAAEILKEAQAGITFLPEDSDDLYKKAIKLSSMEEDELLTMGQTGKNYYQENLSIESSTDKIENHLLRLHRQK